MESVIHIGRYPKTRYWWKCSQIVIKTSLYMFKPMKTTLHISIRSHGFVCPCSCVDLWRLSVTSHSPSIAYFISWANRFHITSALILPTLSSWGNLNAGEKEERGQCVHLGREGKWHGEQIRAAKNKQRRGDWKGNGSEYGEQGERDSLV